MKLIAHRGKIKNSDIANSRQSFLNALSKPYISGIECDVRLTKDLKVVVIHDPVIDFVSDGTGIVKYMTLRELKKYQFENESISTLQELLQIIHTDKMILIELKEENDHLAEQVNKIIMKYPHLHIVIVSFWPSVLEYIKKQNSVVETGLLIGYFLNNDKMENHFDYNFFTYHYIEKINMKKQIGYFTINQKKQLDELLTKREDIYIITDVASHFVK